MAAKHQFTLITVDPAYTEEERRAIALDLIDYIRDRTKEGKGPGGKEWSGKAGEYSKSYENSLDYKIAGKDGTVDLTLSGDMLDSLQIRSVAGTQIKIGFQPGSKVNAQAEGNILGTYGQSKPIPGKARPFLDLTKEEIEKVLERYPVDNAESRSFRTTVRNAVQDFQGQALDIFAEDDDG